MNSTSYVNYLEAKQSVDDRSINQNVWTTFVQKVNKGYRSKSFHLLEIGAGTGHTFFKILDALELHQYKYSIVEIESDHVSTLVGKLSAWGEIHGGKVEPRGEGQYMVQLPGKEIEVQIIEQDIESFLGAHIQEKSYDAIVGQAIIDLLDIDKIFPLMARVVKRGGLYYFPISFDGMTSFVPVYNIDVDRKVEKIYHDSMLRGGRDRSQTGRQILVYLLNNGFQVDAVGSSDWIIYPDRHGNYEGREGYFLRHILDLVAKELALSSQIEERTAHQWYSHRLLQLERGELIYIAHQLDILAANE